MGEGRYVAQVGRQAVWQALYIVEESWVLPSICLSVSCLIHVKSHTAMHVI